MGIRKNQEIKMVHFEIKKQKKLRKQLGFEFF